MQALWFDFVVRESSAALCRWQECAVAYAIRKQPALQDAGSIIAVTLVTVRFFSVIIAMATAMIIATTMIIGVYIVDTGRSDPETPCQCRDEQQN